MKDKKTVKTAPLLGVGALLAYGLVFMIPISPIAIYGYVHHASHGMVPLVYLIGAGAMLFTALSYRKMSEVYPIGGSVFSYVSASVGNRMGFITGWIVLMDYILIPALVYRLSASWIQDIFPSMPLFLWIFPVVLFNTFINCRGITLTSRMSFILLSLQIASLIFFLVCTYHYIHHHNELLNYTRPFYQPENFNITFIGSALSIALLNYLGFDGISTLSEETKNAKKTIGNAIIIALLLITIIFIVQTYAASVVSQYLNFTKETAFFDIAYAIGGPLLYSVLMIVNIISIGIASALVTQAASARILNVMGRNQVLPYAKYLSQMNSRFQTPIVATCLSGFLALLCALLFDQEALIALVSFGGLTAYLILNYSVIHRFFFIEKINWLFNVVSPLLAILLISFVWIHFEKKTFLAGGFFILIGMLFFANSRRKAI